MFTANQTLESTRPKDTIRLLFRVSNVSKGYPYGRKGKIKVLERLNLCIIKGSITGIVGVSGCGKTTLLHILGATDRPDSGEVICEGMRLQYDNKRQMERFRMNVVARIFQDLNLASHLNVIRNVMFPLDIRGESKTRARIKALQSLANVGLLGNGPHNKSKSRIYNLSGGERQRVAIARALASGARVILADEPTGNIDSNTTIKIMDLLRDINMKMGVSMVFVSHDKKIAKDYCRFIIDLEHVKENPPKTVFYGVPAERYETAENFRVH